MKKKMITALLASAMVLSLVACGGGGTDSNGGGDTSSSGSGTSSSSDSNKLTVWAWDQNFNIKAIETAAEQYKKDHPDFELEVVETSSDDCQTKLTTAANAGDYSTLPDIVLMQDNSYQKFLKSYPDAFTDLTDMGINWDDFGALKQSYSMVDDTHYGVPFDNGAEIACYRTDILEQAGYTIKDLTDIDWDQFIKIGEDVYSKTGYSLLSVQAASSDLIYQMLQSAGFSTWKDDNTPDIKRNKNINQCIEIYKEMVDKHVLAVVNSWDEYIATFTSGKTCGVMNGCWILASVQTAADQSGKWGLTNMPKLPGVDSATNYSNQGGSTWAITKNCKNTKLAADFLAKTFAGSKELYDTILPKSGAIATWLPASESEVYNEPQEFFGGQAIYKEIADYASKTPSVNLGVYYTEANTALTTALANVVGGGDIDSELETAQQTVEFNMGK